MNEKVIDFVTYPQETHWVGDGFRVHNFIPEVPGMRQYHMDPFIMMDYNAKMSVSPGAKRGVGAHPHRGFNTVTFAYKGSVAHHDSKGHSGVINEGDVQWMTAAGGVLHEEYYSEDFAKQGGEFQMVQLWINLPAKHKMDNPTYQAIKREDMAVYELENNGGIVEIVSGQYKDIVGPAHSKTDVRLMNLRLNKGGRADFSFPKTHATALLVLNGQARVNGVEVPENNLLKFKKEGEDFKIEALETDTIILLMSGEPMHEPIAAWGPFVMNTHEEIQQAYRDYGNGKFGWL